MKTEILNHDCKTEKSLWDSLQAFLTTDTNANLTCVMAYASGWGVQSLEEEFRSFGPRATVFLGAGNGVTSKQAVETLIKTGARVWLFHTGSPHILFHPKIWIREGTQTRGIFGGSGNLTQSGLTQNFETCFRFEGKTDDPDMQEQMKTVMAQADRFMKEFSSHLLEVESTTDAETLVDMGWLIDEHSVTQQREKRHRHAQWLTQESYAPSPLPKRSVALPQMAQTGRNTTPTAQSGQRTKANSSKRNLLSQRALTAHTPLRHGFYGERDLHAPVMVEIVSSPEKALTTHQVKTILRAKLQTTRKDREKLTGTGQPRMHKIIENMISHRHVKTSLFGRGFLLFEAQTGTWKLTQKGEQAYHAGLI